MHESIFVVTLLVFHQIRDLHHYPRQDPHPKLRYRRSRDPEFIITSSSFTSNKEAHIFIYMYVY